MVRFILRCNGEGFGPLLSSIERSIMDGEALTDEIKDQCGRINDVELITDARCAVWLNQAQKKIAEKVPGLMSTDFKNTTSVDTTQVLSYNLTEWTVGPPLRTGVADASTGVCHVFALHYLDGNESVQLDYVPLDEWDKISDPTHSDYPFDKPNEWTRRGQTVEVRPICATVYCDKDLRMDGNYWPHDFTTNDSNESDISRADEGLILYGLYKAWMTIGDRQKAVDYNNQFMGWLDDFKQKNDTMHEWEGLLYG